jgi:hypothetical protein
MPALSRNCGPSADARSASSGGKPGRRPVRIPSDVPEEGQMAHFAGPIAKLTVAAAAPIMPCVLA